MLSEQDDRNQEPGLSNLRKGFRELYDEIDQLSRQASLTAQSTRSCLADTELLRKQHVDDLLVHARKFIREARSSIVTFDEHGVQCDAEKKSNKKVATPASWMKPPEPVPALVKPEENTRRKSIIQITQLVPKGSPRAGSPQPQLNNKVSVAQPKEVRNIGTNVNFVAQRAVKRTNMHGYVLPVSRSCPKRTQSVTEERSQPALKPSAPSTAPASVGRRPANQPVGRIFSDAQFKQLFDRFLLMQSKKKELEENEPDAQPTEEQLVEHTENVQNETQSPTEVRSEAKVAMDDVVHGSNNADPVESDHNNKQEQIDKNLNEEQSIDYSTLPKFSRHTLPSVSIQGRWDANLRVQQTGSIVIMDRKDDERNCGVPSNNVKYVELRQGQTATGDGAGNQIDRSEFEKESNLVMLQNQVADQTKLNEEVNTPEMEVQFSANNESSTPPGHQEPGISSKEDSPRHKQPVLLVPKSVCRSASAAQKLSKKRNKYLEPFLSLNHREKCSKSSQEVVMEVFDDDSSSTSNDEDVGEDDVRLLLNLNEDTSSESAVSAEKPEDQNVALKMPKTPQCQRSLLEVSSIPALRSPSKGSNSNTSTSDVGISSHGISTERFLSKLRIWNSAVEAQSKNMHLGNQLTETIDVIKENIQKITQESSHIVQMTEHLKNNATETGTMRSRRMPSPPEHPFGCAPPSPTLAVRGRSCECFGCQKTFDEPVGRPLSSPLEQNPRYAKTIRKIRTLGDSFGGEKRSGIAEDRREKAKRAAHIFLQSLHGKPKNERSNNSQSSSRTDSSLVVSNTHSEDAFDSVDSGSYCSLAASWANTGSDPLTSNSPPHEIQSSIELDFAGEMNVECTTSESGGSFSSTLRQSASIVSDEGEILSQGEVK